MGYNLRITRRQHGSNAPLSPITLSEWRELVTSDPEFRCDPSNGDDVALWVGPSALEVAGLFWHDGEIESKYPDAALIEKMVELAAALDARVVGDDGEVYGREGSVAAPPTDSAPDASTLRARLAGALAWIHLLKDRFTPLKLPFSVGSRVRDSWGNQATVIRIDPGSSAMCVVTVRYDDGRILGSSKIAHGLESVEPTRATEELESPTFEVTDHFYLPGRAAFVIGHIRSGLFRNGMSIQSPDEVLTLTISGIEFMDNLAERKHWNALTFRERPTLDQLKRHIPVGSILLAK